MASVSSVLTHEAGFRNAHRKVTAEGRRHDVGSRLAFSWLLLELLLFFSMPSFARLTPLAVERSRYEAAGH